MNIFKILANGDGSINEPNVSAFLGYLLDPYQEDHGLGFEFLDRFLKKVLKNEKFETKEFVYEILFEQAFKEENKRKQIVDIVILCFTKERETIVSTKKRGSKKESLVKKALGGKIDILDRIIIIENKIRATGEGELQINEQFKSILEELKIDVEKVHSVYLTLDEENARGNFMRLDNESRTHFVWKKINENEANNEVEMHSIIKSLSEKDSLKNNSYTEKTIKAFLEFIETGFRSQIQEKYYTRFNRLEEIGGAITFLEKYKFEKYSDFLKKLDRKLKTERIKFQYKTNETEKGGNKISIISPDLGPYKNKNGEPIFCRLEFKSDKLSILIRQELKGDDLDPKLFILNKSKEYFKWITVKFENLGNDRIISIILDSYQYHLINQ